MTPKERNAKWLELESIYLPNRDYGDIEFPKTGGIWQGQLHIYQIIVMLRRMLPLELLKLFIDLMPVKYKSRENYPV